MSVHSHSSMAFSMREGASRKKANEPANMTFAKRRSSFPSIRSMESSRKRSGPKAKAACGKPLLCGRHHRLLPQKARGGCAHRSAFHCLFRNRLDRLDQSVDGLPRVRKKGDAVDLGDWEYCEADGGLFVLPGVYTYGKIAYDETGARTIKPVTKIRGGDAKRYAATVKTNQWLIESVLAAWRKPFHPQRPEQFPRIVAEYTKYITAGKRARVARPLEAGGALDARAWGNGGGHARNKRAQRRQQTRTDPRRNAAGPTTCRFPGARRDAAMDSSALFPH